MNKTLLDYYTLNELIEIKNSITCDRITWSNRSIKNKINIDVIKNIFKLSPIKFSILLNYYFKNNHQFPICSICKDPHVNFHRTNLKNYCIKKECKGKSSGLKRKQTFINHPDILIKINKKRKQTNLKKYGTEWITNSKHFKEKSKETLMKNYGVEHPMHSKEIKEAYSKLCYEKFGHAHHFSSKKVQEKRKITNKEKYACEHITQSEYFRKKSKETSIKNWGFEHPCKSPKVIEKTRQNCFKKRGVYHHMHVDAIKEKTFENSLKATGKRKEYKLGNRLFYVQGYEPQALDYLINIEHIYPNDISLDKASGRPTIQYICPEDSKERLYFPDIYIKSQNCIIEIKSLWTYRKEKRNLIFAKLLACKSAGYKTLLYIMKGDGSLIEKIYI